MIFQLAYVSRARSTSKSCTMRPALERIVEQSMRHNAEAGITGAMVHDAGRFAQVLEGERRAVEDLYLRIACDPRHHEVVLAGTRQLERRDFSSWTMGGIDVDTIPSLTAIKRPGWDGLSIEFIVARVEAKLGWAFCGRAGAAAAS